MEKLQIEVKDRFSSAWHAGNEVLRISFPVIHGETPAARHTAALVAALVTYAEGTVADTAAEALSTAAKSGRLFDFVRHSYRIAVQVTANAEHTVITLTADHAAGATALHFHTLTMYWSADQTLQLKKAPRERTHTLKKARTSAHAH